MLPRKLFIDAQVVDFPVVNTIKSRLNISTEVVASATEIYQHVRSAEDPIQTGKEILFLTKNKGVFIRSCPGTRAYTCCGYKVLHIGTFCNLDCSYCILQSYFHPPVLQHYVNYETLFSDLGKHFNENRIQRIGTGEFTDSLIWEPWTTFSHELIDRFSKQSSAVLELKTKTTNIEGLEKICHNQKTIVAWSLNTDHVIRTEERRTASLKERLVAAATCEIWGYPLAFHFDPMVIYERCKADYIEVVDQLFSSVSPDRIVWISLGTFRFIPSLKPILQKRFPNSPIPYGEFIPGKDGKMRYFRSLRVDLYRAIISRIRKWTPDVLVYLCMEDNDMWTKTIGFDPSEKGGLPAILDHRAAKVCGLKTKYV